MIIASLTTIPPRILNGNLKLTIDSLLNQTYSIDKIYISIPLNYIRFDPINDLPNWLNDEPYKNKIYIIRPENDKGPIEKYLSITKHLYDKDINPFILICDDDQIYHPNLLSTMIKAIPSNNYEGVIQNRYEIVRYGSGGIVHGFVGLLVKLSCLRPLLDFPIYNECYMVDDQIMSIYFKCYNIPIISSGIIEYKDIYNVLENNHERCSKTPESLSGASNRKELINTIQKIYSVNFINGGDIHINIDWSKLNISQYKKIIALGSDNFIHIIRTINSNVKDRYTELDNDCDVIFIEIKDKSIINIKNIISSLVNNINNVDIYIKVDRLSLEMYNIIKNFTLWKVFNKYGIKHILPNMYKLRVCHIINYNLP